MKRALYLIHRWLGVVLCLFMAMWFFSGVVMMYVGYPKLTPAERLASLPALDVARCCATLPALLAATGRTESPTAVRLTSVAGVPRVLLSYGRSEVVAVDAVSARRINAVTVADALAAAQAFMPGLNASYQAQVMEDVWTHSKAMEPHRPLHRIQMDDAQFTVLYVSSQTGEVVRDATGTERVWNWVGAWIHWLYPFRGGLLDGVWSEIVIYTSIAATVLALLGMVVGVWRWRFAGRFSSGSRSPYREPWMRWHHLLGLVFGAVTVTFIFSGLMSMNPFKVLDSGAPKLAQRMAKNEHWQARHFDSSAQQALSKFVASGFAARELEWRMVAGAGYVLALDGQGRSRLLAAGAGSGHAQPFEAFSMAQMQTLGSALFAQNKVIEASVLNGYDTYYYSREPHTMSGGAKHLPVLRLKFDDAQASWLQLDPRTGAVINQLDAYGRVRRWLFAFLHSWDWLPLLERRPLWDIWMVLLSGGGFIISVTGTVLGWRRLQRKRNSWQRACAPVPAAS
jgi:uncharacterized iron-regulated membrane protein